MEKFINPCEIPEIPRQSTENYCVLRRDLMAEYSK